MDFDLRQLEALVHVVEEGSFKAASNTLHLSQAAVSERIANLEHGVGLRLLDRLPREIRMTSAGQHLYERAKQLLGYRRTIYHELEELAGVVRGTLVIGASTIPGEYVLPRLLPNFFRIYPKTDLSINISNSEKITAEVRDGDLDLGVIGAEPADNRLHCEWLWKDQLKLVVPAGHRLTHRKQIKAEELAGETLIIREAGSGTRKLMESVFAGQGIDIPKSCVAVGSTTAVKEAILAGLGVSILSERAVQTEVNAGLLVAMNIHGMKFDRHFLLVTNPLKTPSPLCIRFMHYLKETLQRSL